MAELRAAGERERLFVRDGDGTDKDGHGVPCPYEDAALWI